MAPSAWSVLAEYYQSLKWVQLSWRCTHINLVPLNCGAHLCSWRLSSIWSDFRISRSRSWKFGYVAWPLCLWLLHTLIFKLRIKKGFPVLVILHNVIMNGIDSLWGQIWCVFNVALSEWKSLSDISWPYSFTKTFLINWEKFTKWWRVLHLIKLKFLNRLKWIMKQCLYLIWKLYLKI